MNDIKGGTSMAYHYLRSFLSKLEKEANLQD
jgi:hypothetical protein